MLEEEDITRDSFIEKINELKKNKKNIIDNIKKGKGKIGNEAVINVIMQSLKK